MKAAGYGGLLTAIQNSSAATNMLLNGPVKAMDDLKTLLALANDPNATPAQIQALEQKIFTGIDAATKEAFDKAILVPGNATADALAHELIRSVGMVGNGTTINGGVGVKIDVNIAGTGLILTTSADATFAYAVGSPGDDSIVGQAARNLLMAGAGNDRISVSTGSNYLSGGDGDDVVMIGGGSNRVDGGAGLDTVVMTGGLGSYAPRFMSAGGEVGLSSGSRSNSIAAVERIRFDDGTLIVPTSTPLIDPLYYSLHNHDVFGAGLSSDMHFRYYGWQEGRDPNALFTVTNFLQANPDIRAAGINPLVHYQLYGWKEGRDPSAQFDTQLYLVHNPDVAAAGINPLVHYLGYGQFEGRQTYTMIGSTIVGDSFDRDYYLMRNPDVGAAGIDPYVHFMNYGWKEGRDPNGYFDTSAYLDHYQDVAAAGINPFVHYNTTGWREGRDASDNFGTNAYLNDNRDIAAAGLNPLTHFIRYGALEGRANDMVTTWATPQAAITLGTAASGEITGPTDRDDYSVFLEKGHRYVIDFDNLPSTAIDRASIDIFQPFPFSYVSSFHVVTEKETRPVPGIKYIVAPTFEYDIFGYSAAMSGVHKVSIGNAETDAGGTYSFSIVDVTDQPARRTFTEAQDFGATRSTAVDLGKGTAGDHAFSVSGAVSASDRDVLMFWSPGGQVEITASDPDWKLTFELYQEADFPRTITGLREVGSSDTSLIVNLDRGTYYLEVSSKEAFQYGIDFWF